MFGGESGYSIILAISQGIDQQCKEMEQVQETRNIWRRSICTKTRFQESVNVCVRAHIDIQILDLTHTIDIHIHVHIDGHRHEEGNKHMHVGTHSPRRCQAPASSRHKLGVNKTWSKSIRPPEHDRRIFSSDLHMLANVSEKAAVSPLPQHMVSRCKQAPRVEGRAETQQSHYQQ